MISDQEVSPSARKLLKSALTLTNLGDLKFLAEKIEALYELHKESEDIFELSSETERELIESAWSILRNEEISLQGPDAALLASWLLITEYLAEQFNSRQVSKILNENNRSVANITSTINSLIDRGLAETVENRSEGHRHYLLTRAGHKEAIRLIQGKADNIVEITKVS